MNLWKTVCAVLFSLLLIASQTVFSFSATAVLANNARCCCCDCGQTACCAAPETPPSQPLSASSRGLSQNQIQLIAVTVSQLVHLLEQRIENQISIPTASVSLISVPLYTRHCSFLI